MGGAALKITPSPALEFAHSRPCCVFTPTSAQKLSNSGSLLVIPLEWLTHNTNKGKRKKNLNLCRELKMTTC